MPQVNSSEPSLYVINGSEDGPKFESIPLADEVSLEIEVEHLDGKESDTQVSIDGVWFVDTSKRKEFAEKLQALISEYQV